MFDVCKMRQVNKIIWICVFFVCFEQLWCDELLEIAHNILQINNPITSYLKKSHTRLTILLDKQGKIPVKNIIKTFTQHKDDRKRVEKALDAAGLPSGKVKKKSNRKCNPVRKKWKLCVWNSACIRYINFYLFFSFIFIQNDTISPSKFTFEEFFQFYKNMTGRNEVEKVFDEITQSSKKKLMTAEQFMEFLNKGQRDPRLNEILYPYTTTDKAKEIINTYEPNQYNRSKAQLSLDGFLRYLLSDDNSVVSQEKLDLADDMDQPLSHYFINSSHNTYLTGKKTSNETKPTK